MSRRKLRSSQAVFLSDDEDEFLNDEVTSRDSGVNIHMAQVRDSEWESSVTGSHVSEAGSERIGSSRVTNMATSTPVISHDQQQGLVPDRYSPGMLLRSGSRIRHSTRYYSDQISDRAEKNAFGSAYRSDLSSASRHHSARNFITVTETTTTTTTTEPGDKKEQSHKRATFDDDQSERKLRQDESQTEKSWNRQHYRLEHLYGLDSEEEISDIDDGADVHMAETADLQHSQRQFSFFSYITTVVTTIATITTAAVTSTSTILSNTFSSDGSSSWMKLWSHAASTSFIAPGRWLLQSTSDFIRWLISRSASFLLWDIDMKQNRRRGCCYCFLPLLFLLPVLLLGGYYTSVAQHDMDAFMSQNKQTSTSSSWLSYLWLTSSSTQVPVYKTDPGSQTSATETQQRIIQQYIQQAVTEAMAANKNDRPVGLNREQVEAVVEGLLTREIKLLKAEVEGRMDFLKDLMQTNVTQLQQKIVELESGIRVFSQAHQELTDKLIQVNVSFEGLHSGQKVEWQAAFHTLQEKLLNLSGEVHFLSSQNAALTAMLTNCCRNNSDIADIVRAHVISVLSQMDTDEDIHGASQKALAVGERYVDKTELEQTVSAMTVNITENVKIILAQMEEKSNIANEIKTSVIGGFDEQTVKSIVEAALSDYSADRVGRPDFALESAGGSVVSVRCSETYYKKTALVSIFGIPLWYTSNSPRTVIQPNVHPGECWAFKGQMGFIVFQLSHPIQPTGFTLDHIPLSLAPTGDISSAPKDFAVFGLISESDTQGISLGNFSYLYHENPPQYFPVQNDRPGIFQLIELRILNNHGNSDYTCIYRFRVHGLP